jgi:hypothetical protein
VNYQNLVSFVAKPAKKMSEKMLENVGVRGVFLSKQAKNMKKVGRNGVFVAKTSKNA